MISPERRTITSSLNSTSQKSYSSPVSSKSFQLIEIALLSPEPKNSRKKAYINRLFSSNKKNILDFDEPIQESHQQLEMDGSFEIVMEEPAQSEQWTILAKFLSALKGAQSLEPFFVDTVDINIPIQVLQEYALGDDFVYDVDTLDGQILISAQGSAFRNKPRQMHISALLAAQKIARMKIQFI